MGKAARIRDALTKAAANGLTYAQLVDKTGIDGKSLGPNLSSFKQRGEVTIAEKEGEVRYHLASDFKRRGAAVPPPQRKKHKKSAKPKKRIKRAARNAEPALDGAPNGLHHRHLATTFAALKAVLDLDGADAAVTAVFRAHEEAIELAIGAAH